MIATPTIDAAGPFGACPLPRSSYDRILLGHGSGGLLTAELIGSSSSRHSATTCSPRSRTRRLSDCRRTTATATAPRRHGSPSPPIRSSSGRCSSRAAISAGWPSTARSTTWPSAAPGRCICPRRSSSRRGCRSPTSRRIVASMRHGVRRGRGGAGHRRHQGRRPGQGGPDLHHDHRHRPRARGRIALDPLGAARRPDRRLGDDRRPRHRHHVGARGDRVRDRPGKRLGAR